MKQAVLITAYKNIGHLHRIMACFDDNFRFYIHVDKKSKLKPSKLEELNNTSKLQYFSNRYTTNWGCTAHLYSILNLLQNALQKPDNAYFHLISGHDFPIQTPAYFQELMKQNRGTEFMEVFPLPASVWENGGLDRLRYVHLHDWIDAKGPYGKWIHRFVRFQKLLGFKRSLDFKGLALYGGSTWWSLSRESCDYVNTFLRDNVWFLKKFKHSFCAEEILFQTVLMNSPFKNNISNTNLRHIVWELRNGNLPAVLDERDLESLMASKDLFARRFEYPQSQKLMDELSK